jgi:hypothetical protein
MGFFTTLTPAENLIIRDQRRASHKQMLELIFMDLLLKKVLKMEYVKDETTSRANNPNEGKVAYVSIGENYRTYAPVPHEKIFLKPFVTIVSTRILLSSLIKVLYESAEGPRYFRAYVGLSPRISKYFRSPLFFHTIGFQPLNKKGLQVQEQIFAEQIKLTGELSSLWNYDRQKALDIIDQIKGNVFLLPLSKDIIQSIGVEFDHTVPSKVVDQSAGGGCGGFFYSDMHHHVSTGFDEGDSDWSSSDSSGCGGDSGCSGCGGD